MTRALHRWVLAVAFLVVAAVSACERGPSPAQTKRDDGVLMQVLAPASTPSQRSGIAAAILVDVSRSMSLAPRGASEPKIESARRAALGIVDQFARYAADHPSEPVLLGIYEFSVRPGEASAREVIPMGPPRRDRAASAIAQMTPAGDTPIGDALIAGKLVLDATGLTQRHLLVITDGENTRGYPPGQVAAAIGRRPESERPSIYFVAFDIEASKFNDVKNAGALVLEAADSRGLNQRLDTLLRGEILLER